MKHRLVFSYRLMEYLLQQGFAQVDMHPIDNNPSKNVYVFIRSPQLKRAIKNYYKN